MPRYAALIAPLWNTDAGMRAAITAIKAGIEAVGWVQTSDTGQLNPATVLGFTTTNQNRGYLMWRMADSLQSTNPILLKISFQSASGNAAQCVALVTTLTLSDGAGNVSGTSYFYNRNYNWPPSNATAYECYFSGDTNRLAISFWDNWTATTDGHFLAVERSHDNTGADTNIGWMTWQSNNSINAGNNRFTPFLGPVPPELSLWMGPVPNGNPSTLIGSQIGMFPIMPFYTIALNPSTQLLTYESVDISPNTMVNVSLYGATRTFLTLRQIKGAMNVSFAAMRWDS